MTQEFGAVHGNIPDPNHFPAVCAAPEGMGLEISQGAEDPKIDQLIISLFAVAAQAKQAEPITTAIAEFISKPEEE